MRAVLEWGEQKCSSENPRRAVLDAAGKNDNTRTTEKWSEKKMRNNNNANDGGDGASGGVGEKRR